MSNFLYALTESIALSYFKKKIQDWIETKRRRKRTVTCKCWTLEQNPYLPGQKEKGGSTIGVLKSRFPAFFLLNPAIPPLFMPGSWSRPIFLRDFWHFLLDHWNMRYDLPSNNCQFWWSRFSTSQLAKSSGYASKPQNHKLITVAVCGLVISRLIGLFLWTQ